MDKYQRTVLEFGKERFFYCSSKKNSTVLDLAFDFEKDCYTLIQEEDIFSTQYQFTFKLNSNIEACAFYRDGDWQNAEQRGGCFFVMLDFDNRIEKVKLEFADNIVDEYIFSIQYVEADKNLYYQKKEAEVNENKLAAARIKHAVGADLVNIYFQPCCEQYAQTEIILYRDNIVLAKYKVDEEIFFKSINGLAYGTYSYVVKQFDKQDKLLLETEHIEFKLLAPKTSHNAIRPHINKI